MQVEFEFNGIFVETFCSGSILVLRQVFVGREFAFFFKKVRALVMDVNQTIVYIT